MERRKGPRGRTKFEVISTSAWGVEHLEAVAISPSGLVVRGTRPLREPRLVRALELELPERARRLSVLARPVRSFGEYEALRFVEVDDADRLNIAEHLDLLHTAGELTFDLSDGLERELALSVATTLGVRS
jgi:hypothetical protein